MKLTDIVIGSGGVGGGGYDRKTNRNAVIRKVFGLTCAVSAWRGFTGATYSVCLCAVTASSRSLVCFATPKCRECIQAVCTSEHNHGGGCHLQ